jgi:hypothetical protein
MLLDADVSGKAEVSGKNVTLVRPKEAVRPTESIGDLKQLRTIMQYDLEAGARVSSTEIVYVKTGVAARPAENTR